MGNAIDNRGKDGAAGAQDAAGAPDAPAHRGPTEASLRHAVLLTAPAAVGAFTAALTALEDGDTGRLAFGVALGALLGAGVAGLLTALYREETPPAGAPLNKIEEIGEDAAQAAALLGGPAASLSEALCDARRIMERLPFSILLLDARGVILFANPEAEQELGRRLSGQHFSTALRAPALAAAVREAYEGRPLAEIDFAQRRFQERHFHAVVRALSPPVDGAPEAGEMAEMRGHARVAVVLQDQTRMRRAEQLHRDFVANASHELKTPLASVAGFIETLRGPAKDDAVARERFLRIMAQQAERMRRLVEDLLSLNRIELNEHVPPRDTLDVAALVRRVAEQTPEFEEGRIEIGLDGAPQPALVRADAAQLEQVFVNLIENALKYGGERKPVRLHAAQRDTPRRQIGVSVEDFGPGIPKEHVPRLTERFYRVGDQPGKLKSGTGLGLSIVKHAVSRHRGELEVDSRLGRGSRFTVWLPRAEDFDGTPPAA